MLRSLKKIIFHLHFSTFNWVIGNTNPMDYIPPFMCNKARLDESEAPVTMFAALESLARKTRTEE